MNRARDLSCLPHLPNSIQPITMLKSAKDAGIPSSGESFRRHVAPYFPPSLITCFRRNFYAFFDFCVPKYLWFFFDRSTTQITLLRHALLQPPPLLLSTLPAAGFIETEAYCISGSKAIVCLASRSLNLPRLVRWVMGKFRRVA